MVAGSPSLSKLVVLLAFNANNQLAVRDKGGQWDLPFTGEEILGAEAAFRRIFPADELQPKVTFTVSAEALYEVACTQVQADPNARIEDVVFRSIADLESRVSSVTLRLAAVLAELEPRLIQIPYLHLGENDFIYKFRPDKERNRLIYQLDDVASSLYQSKLCTAIKALARTHERTASEPVTLNFGAVEYVIPSHFGFCLGVKNAIERAYESLAENRGRRVFMLSELIHNPFVNEDLLRRGLRYLQTDKGIPYTTENRKATGVPGEMLLWDTLVPEDIVVIPAFGATDHDKRRLVRKGIPVYEYDATCMLVEKVWKAARAFGREGYTVVIHGKHEHEETKATFSNAQRYAPAVIVRNLEEAQRLGEIIASPDAAGRTRFYADFAGKHTPGFDVAKDLERIAVVNQTTLLMNETLEIIEHLRGVFTQKFGAAESDTRVGGNAKRDTLCYATQVNQDALSKALSEPLDGAFVIGGKNSSNTYQLFRLCEQRLGTRAFFIQGEQNIRSLAEVEHYVFPAKGPATSDASTTEVRPFSARAKPLRLLLTGGASCPDGIIQQVITRINGLLDPHALRSIDEVLTDLEQLRS